MKSYSWISMFYSHQNKIICFYSIFLWTFQSLLICTGQLVFFSFMLDLLVWCHVPSTPTMWLKEIHKVMAVKDFVRERDHTSGSCTGPICRVNVALTWAVLSRLCLLLLWPCLLISNTKNFDWDHYLQLKISDHLISGTNFSFTIPYYSNFPVSHSCPWTRIHPIKV